MGKALYQQEMEQHSDKILPPSTKEHRTVRYVFDQLVPHSGLRDNAWDIHVIDEPNTSAYVLPGGKVFVYRGMLDLCARNDELAVVLGHEIAHNVAHHTSESLSRGLIIIPIFIISCLASGMNPDLVNLGTDVAFRLPGSRAQEVEADYLGLQIMAESGFDPSAALDLWARWEFLDEFKNTPEYLRTHPSHHNRLENINSWLLQAREKRKSKHYQSRESAEQILT